ncbi:MAG: hypothetical protein ACTSRA_08235 [Promethearchaeota archaeon]
MITRHPSFSSGNVSDKPALILLTMVIILSIVLIDDISITTTRHQTDTVEVGNHAVDKDMTVKNGVHVSAQDYFYPKTNLNGSGPDLEVNDTYNATFQDLEIQLWQNNITGTHVPIYSPSTREITGITISLSNDDMLDNSAIINWTASESNGSKNIKNDVYAQQFTVGGIGGTLESFSIYAQYNAIVLLSVNLTIFDGTVGSNIVVASYINDSINLLAVQPEWMTFDFDDANIGPGVYTAVLTVSNVPLLSSFNWYMVNNTGNPLEIAYHYNGSTWEQLDQGDFAMNATIVQQGLNDHVSITAIVDNDAEHNKTFPAMTWTLTFNEDDGGPWTPTLGAVPLELRSNTSMLVNVSVNATYKRISANSHTVYNFSLNETVVRWNFTYNAEVENWSDTLNGTLYNMSITNNSHEFSINIPKRWDNVNSTAPTSMQFYNVSFIHVQEVSSYNDTTWEFKAEVPLLPVTLSINGSIFHPGDEIMFFGSTVQDFTTGFDGNATIWTNETSILACFNETFPPGSTFIFNSTFEVPAPDVLSPGNYTAAVLLKNATDFAFNSTFFQIVFNSTLEFNIQRFDVTFNSTLNSLQAGEYENVSEPIPIWVHYNMTQLEGQNNITSVPAPGLNVTCRFDGQECTLIEDPSSPGTYKNNINLFGQTGPKVIPMLFTASDPNNKVMPINFTLNLTILKRNHLQVDIDPSFLANTMDFKIFDNQTIDVNLTAFYIDNINDSMIPYENNRVNVTIIIHSGFNTTKANYFNVWTGAGGVLPLTNLQIPNIETGQPANITFLVYTMLDRAIDPSDAATMTLNITKRYSLQFEPLNLPNSITEGDMISFFIKITYVDENGDVYDYSNKTIHVILVLENAKGETMESWVFYPKTNNEGVFNISNFPIPMVEKGSKIRLRVIVDSDNTIMPTAFEIEPISIQQSTWLRYGTLIVSLLVIIPVAFLFFVRFGVPKLQKKNAIKKIELIQEKQAAILSSKKPRAMVELERDLSELDDIKSTETFPIMHMEPQERFELDVSIFKDKGYSRSRYIDSTRIEARPGPDLPDYNNLKREALAKAAELEAIGKYEDAIKEMEKACEYAEKLGKTEETAGYRRKIEDLKKMIE